MPKEEGCKHENAEGMKHCPDCGEKLEDAGKAELKAAVREVLEEAGILKPAKPAASKKTSVYDRALGKK